MATPAVAVIGDIMVDSTFYGRVTRISPEAPIPVLEKQYLKDVPGGAANLAGNLRAMVSVPEELDVCLFGCANPELVVLHKDVRLVVGGACPTVNTKLRFVDTKTNYQLLRVDNEQEARIDSYHLPVEETMEQLGRIENLQAVAFSDYTKGAITGALAREVIAWCNQKGIATYVDTRRENPEIFRCAGYIAPNSKEFEAISHYCHNCKQEYTEQEKLDSILEDFDLVGILLKKSEEGMLYYDREYKFNTKPDFKDIVDVTGAGDTALAGFILAKLFLNLWGHPEGLTGEENLAWYPMYVANYFAGEVCMISGTAVPTTTLRDLWTRQVEV